MKTRKSFIGIASIFLVLVLMLTVLTACDIFGDKNKGLDTEKEYTVTFKNGDTVVSETMVRDGHKIKSQDIPAARTAPEGKVWAGWYIGNVKLEADKYTVTTNVTVNAKFEVKKCTVSMILQGSSATVLTHKLDYNTTLTFSHMPGSNVLPANKSVSKVLLGTEEIALGSYKVKRDITLTLVLQDNVNPDANKCRVRFIVDGIVKKTVDITKNTPLLDSHMYETPEAPEGYVWGGWYYNTTKVSAGNIVTKDMDLVAKFKDPNQVDDDTDPSTSTNPTGGKCELIFESITWPVPYSYMDIEIGSVLTTVPDSPIPPEGKSFDGWYDGNTKAEKGVYVIKGKTTFVARFVDATTTPDNPNNPNNPDTPNTPSDPDTPDNPDNPTPDNPTTPDNPNPTDPTNPSTPSQGGLCTLTFTSSTWVAPMQYMDQSIGSVLNNMPAAPEAPAGKSFDGWYDGNTKVEKGVYVIKGTTTFVAKFVDSTNTPNTPSNPGNTDNYSYDDDYHWLDATGKELHTVVGEVCSVCSKAVTYSVGLEYELVEPSAKASAASDGLDYEQNGSYYIVKGIGTARGDIVIPAMHNGLPVKEIGENAFYYDHPDLYVYDYYGTTSVTVPEGIEKIGKQAFYFIGTPADRSNPNAISTIHLPNSVTSIGQDAFSCAGIDYMVVPKSVTEFGYRCFYQMHGKVYLERTREEMEDVTLGGAEFINSSAVYYYCDTTPTTPGTYWRYDGSKIVELYNWVGMTASSYYNVELHRNQIQGQSNSFGVLMLSSTVTMEILSCDDTQGVTNFKVTESEYNNGDILMTAVWGTPTVGTDSDWEIDCTRTVTFGEKVFVIPMKAYVDFIFNEESGQMWASMLLQPDTTTNNDAWDAIWGIYEYVLETHGGEGDKRPNGDEMPRFEAQLGFIFRETNP